MPRSRRLRSLLALVHVLATFVAIWPHDHRAHSAAELLPLVGCDDPTPHFAAHEDAAPAASSLDCPVCLHRALDQSVDNSPCIVDVPVSIGLEAFDPPSAVRIHHDPSRPRAPPSA